MTHPSALLIALALGVITIALIAIAVGMAARDEGKYSERER